MTIDEIIKRYISILEDVKGGNLTPPEALKAIEELQYQADMIDAGFRFTQNLDDLVVLQENYQQSQQSRQFESSGFYDSDPEHYESSWGESSF